MWKRICGLSLLFATAVFAEVTVGSKVPNLDVETVFAERFNLQQALGGRTGLIAFFNKDSAEAARQWLTRSAYRWRAQKDKVVFIAVVDTSEMPAFMKSLAAANVRREADRTTQMLLSLYRSGGGVPPQEPEKIIRFIPDYSRDICKSFGVGDVKSSPLFIVTSRAAKVAAVYPESTDSSFENMKQLVDSLLNGAAAQPAAPGAPPAATAPTGR